MPVQPTLAATEIAEALGRLVEVAQRNDLDLLAFMLDQARLEAEREAEGDGQNSS